MAYNRSLIVAFMMMVSMVAAPAYPADELFDTAAASKHIERGISFLKAKDFDAAIKEFDESATIAPEAEAYYYLGYAYYMKSRKMDGESRRMSLDNFEKAYEIDPNFTPTRYQPSETPPPRAAAAPSPKAAPVAPQPADLQPPAPDQPQP
jgi:tetratricopeptide (TPR) repeat protein